VAGSRRSPFAASSVTTTASGSSTSRRTRNSANDRESYGWASLVSVDGCASLMSGLDDALLLEQGLDRARRLRAALQPVLGTIGVDLDQGRLELRVVAPDVLERGTVARRPGVGDDDAVDRILLGADPGEADLQHALLPLLLALLLDRAGTDRGHARKSGDAGHLAT